MNYNILALRDGLSRLTKLLAGFNIQVNQEGFAARVDYDAQGKPVCITIPYIPDNAEETFLRAIHGFIDHEIAHIFNTNYELVLKAKGLLHWIWNCIEDPYVESCHVKVMPGVQYNYEQLDRFIIKEIYDVQWPEIKNKHNEQLDFLFPLMVRSWFGQPTAQEFMSNKWRYVKTYTDKVEDLIPRVPLCKSTADCFKLAKEFHKRLGYDFTNDYEKKSVQKQLIQTLTSKAKSYQENSNYRIYSTKDDFVGKPTLEPHASRVIRQMNTIDKMDTEAGSLVGVLRKTVERMVIARSRTNKVGGYRSGKLSDTNLWRLFLSDDRVYTKLHPGRSRKVAATLLVDNSGSMGFNRKTSLAMISAYVMMLTLDKVGIPHEVIGYTTGKLKASDHDSKRPKRNNYYARSEPLYMPIYKAFNERPTLQVKERVAYAYNDSHNARNNVDGECLQIAAWRLLKQPADRHLLIVLADGQPLADGNDDMLSAHLKKTARELEDLPNFDLVCIGIKSECVKNYYKNYQVLEELNELPQIVIKLLKKYLLDY